MKSILSALTALCAGAVLLGALGCANLPDTGASDVSAGDLATATLVVAGMT